MGRSLRKRRSFTVGVLGPELSDDYQRGDEQHRRSLDA
jgi:hypothetical protein